MSLDLRQLRQFIAIAELGSFRKAADALYIAQPALSVSIQKLENAIGVQLLERGARGVTLTDAGQALIDDARRSLFHADQARQAARRVALGEWGTLRLGFVGSATYVLLPRCVPAFRRQYPDVRLELREDSTMGVVMLLRSHELDAGLVRGPLADDPNLQSWVIERDDLILAVPADHRLARRKRVRLQECRREGFVMYTPSVVPGLHSVAIGLCRSAGYTPHISQEAIQVQTVVSLVASGLGVALVPGVTRNYSNPHVRFVALADAGASGTLALSLVASRTAPALVLRLRDSMLQTVAGTPAPGVIMTAGSMNRRDT